MTNAFLPPGFDEYFGQKQEFIECPTCGGQGYREGIVEVVSHDMAMDAGDMALENQPLMGRIPCPECGGGGVIGIMQKIEDSDEDEVE